MHKHLLKIISILILLIGCKKETVTTNINAVVRSYDNLQAPPEIPKTLISEEPVVSTVDGITYNCTNKVYRFGQSMDDIAIMRPYDDVLYPGAIVQGRGAQVGELNPVGRMPRAPMTLTLSQTGLSRVIDPTKSNAEAAIQQMLQDYRGNTQASIEYKQTKVHTIEQASLELGIDYRWSRNRIGFRNTSGTTARKSVMMIMFKQAYYTVSVDAPNSPADLFAPETDGAALQEQLGVGNPLCYISSVTYGRMLLVKVESTVSSEELENAVSASFGRWSGQASLSSNNIIENSSIEAVIIGGGAPQAIDAVTSGRIDDFLRSGANFSATNKGLPISYTLRHASDKSIVRVGSAVDYTEKADCVADPASFVPFKFDLLKFDILRDCDNGVLTNTGPGEFRYQVDFFVNGQKPVNSILSNMTREANDFETIPINWPTQTIPVPKRPGYTFRVEVTLWDQDNGSNDVLEFVPLEYSYPYSNVLSAPVQATQILNLRNDCGAILYYRIWKQI